MPDDPISSQPVKSKKSGASPLRLILIVVFVAIAGALGWEFGMVRPKYEAAFGELDELVDKSIKGTLKDDNGAARRVSREDVNRILGDRSPSSTEPGDSGGTVEQYDFPGVFYVYQINLTVEKDAGGEYVRGVEAQPVLRFVNKPVNQEP